MNRIQSCIAAGAFALFIFPYSAFAASDSAAGAGAASHAFGIQTGFVSIDSQVENVNKAFIFRGGVARLRYEFRDKTRRFSSGGYVQGFSVKNTYNDNSPNSSDESATSIGVGLHSGILLGDTGLIDLGIGYQPVRFAIKNSESSDLSSNQQQQYSNALNFCFGLTYISRLKSVEVPIRLQFDYLKLSDGSRQGDEDALFRPVSMRSSALLIGADLRY
jgi:hypothetical protein